MTSMEINNIIEKCKKLGFKGLTIEELIESFIIYLRKSRKDEEIERYIKMTNPDISKEELDKEILKRHEEQIQAYAKQILGFKIPEKCIKREIASGGELEERPVMNEVMLEIEDPKILGVFVYDIERIGRPNTLDTGLLMQAFELTDTKIFVASPPKIWDLTDEFDKDYFEDSLRQARKFLNYTKTKMINGRKQSVREGKFIANGCYGYDRVKITNEKGYTLEPNKDAEAVKNIFDMYLNKNMGTMKIAKYLNEKGIKPPEKDFWQPYMVYMILKRETYAGYVSYGKVATVRQKKDGVVKKTRKKNDNALIVKGRHDPLIDEETYNIVQEKLKKKAFKNVPTSETLRNPLAGLVFCKKCGSSLARRINTINITKDEPIGIDKTEFVKYITKLKNEKHFFQKDISELTGISRNPIMRYFSSKSTVFPKNSYYTRLKEVLGMDNRYDVLLGRDHEYRQVHSLYCHNVACNIVGSYVKDIEKETINQLRKRLKEYNTFLNDYYQDEVKVTKDFKKEIAHLEKDIAGLQSQITTACDLLERKIYTDEMFLDRVNTLNVQIENKKEQIKELQAIDVKEEIIQHEKAVPILETALENYDKFTVEEKNEFLFTFIERIEYSKTKRRNKWDSYTSDMKLDIIFKEL